jgi:hypothetical protein
MLLSVRGFLLPRRFLLLLLVLRFLLLLVVLFLLLLVVVLLLLLVLFIAGADVASAGLFASLGRRGLERRPVPPIFGFLLRLGRALGRVEVYRWGAWPRRAWHRAFGASRRCRWGRGLGANGGRSLCRCSVKNEESQIKKERKRETRNT